MSPNLENKLRHVILAIQVRLWIPRKCLLTKLISLINFILEML